MAEDTPRRGPVIEGLEKATVGEIWGAMLAVDANESGKWSEYQQAALLDQLYAEMARRLGRPPQSTRKDPRPKREGR